MVNGRHIELAETNNSVRQRLLEEAFHAFMKADYNQVTLRPLATKAGTSVSMVTYYFGDKQGLYEEVVRSQFRRIGQALEESYSFEKGIDLEKLMMSYFEIHQSNPDFPAFFINILAYKNAPGYALLAKILDSKREKINQLVSRSQNSGLVKHDLDVDVFRILLMSLSVFPFLIKGVLAESSKVPLNSELLRKVAKAAGVMLATMIKPSDKAC